MEVCDYYKIWGIGESFGMIKMDDGLNLDDAVSDLNPFIWKWQKN
jgi:hypothetical protein